MDRDIFKGKAEVPSKGFTHSAKFHSDDVFATAFLRMINPDIKIERGFDVPENYDGIVYDIGRGRFDHHQEDKEYRENGCPYAAFGLLWREFGVLCVGEEEAAYFDEHFIQPLDESDNTGCSNMIAKIVDEFNPSWDSQDDYDDCFFKAVDFAQNILVNHFNSVAGIYRAKELVQQAMADSDGKILILPKFAPWKGEVVGSSYIFAVYPSNRGGYSIQGVPVSDEDNTLVCNFPEEWCGKTAEELVGMTGIKTFRFCHPNGFLAAADEYQDAVAIAESAIKISNKPVI